VVAGELEAVTGRVRALDEETLGVAVGKRPYRERRLAVDAEHLLAGGEHGHGRTAPHDEVDNARDGVDEMFAVVEHHERMAAGERRDERLLPVALAVLG